MHIPFFPKTIIFCTRSINLEQRQASDHDADRQTAPGVRPEQADCARCQAGTDRGVRCQVRGRQTASGVRPGQTDGVMCQAGAERRRRVSDWCRQTASGVRPGQTDLTRLRAGPPRADGAMQSAAAVVDRHRRRHG